MLRNGSARIISYKTLPQRYLDAGKNALGGGTGAGGGHDQDGIKPAIGAMPETAAAAEIPAPAPEVFEAAPVQVIPTSAEPGTPTDTAAPPAAIQVLPVEVMPETIVIVPAAAQPDTVAQPEGIVSDVPGGPESRDSTPGIPAETVSKEWTPVVPPEAELQDAVPDVPMEMTQKEDLTNTPPGTALSDVITVASPQDGAPATSPEAVQAYPAVISSDAEISAAKPGVAVRVIHPEAEPGGLVAEIHFEGDPAGLVFGEAPGYVSFESAMGVAQSKDYGQEEEDASYPPYVNFTCFNRLGLTIKNLTNLLDSDEEFELNIIDCNSKDNSWDYIQSLTDRRIKSRIHFDKNCGPIFAVNFALRRRKPNQYFIVIDSDTYIKTKNWIARFMEVFNTFPDVGLLGLMRDNPYPRYLPPITPRVSGNVSYLELKNADINTEMDFIPGQLQCLRPALIKEIGYWSEENGFGDAELSPRIVHYTSFRVGFVTTIEIDMTQRITCEECAGKSICTLSRSISDCFSMSRLYNKNESFVAKNTWKFRQTFEELKAGARTAYCASIHDQESVKTHLYNADWAYDNFNHYIINAN